MIFLLSVCPSVILIEKARSYYRFLTGFNPGALRQMTVDYPPRHPQEDEPGSKEIRYVEFSLHAPKAKAVRLTGNFNQWQPLSMSREGPGNWKILMPLPPGTYYYAFEMDGTRTLDPKSKEKSQAGGAECSVRVVR